MYYRRGSVSAARRRSVVATDSDEQRRAYNDPTLADGIYGCSNLVMPESLMLLRRQHSRLGGAQSSFMYPHAQLAGWPARGAQKRSGAELWAVLRECVHDRLNLGTNLLGLSFGPNKLRWKREQEEQEHQEHQELPEAGSEASKLRAAVSVRVGLGDVSRVSCRARTRLL